MNGSDTKAIELKLIHGQRGATKLKCTAAITWFADTLDLWPKRGCPAPKYDVSPLESGGREGIRTLGLLVANEGKFTLRCGTTIT